MDDLRASPLEVWRNVLERVLRPLPHLRLVETFPEVRRVGLGRGRGARFEGMVAKRRRSRCEDRKRSKAWLKVKSYRLSSKVAGYSEGLSNHSFTMGALLVGAYDAQGQLHYTAHVGRGLWIAGAWLTSGGPRRHTLRGLRFFVERPPMRGRLTATWVHPTLVVEVKLAE